MEHVVEFLERSTCGSCERVKGQILPVVKQANAVFIVKDVDSDPELAMEFGDRVPVVLIDGEEFSAWEVDNDELAAALG